MPIRSNDEPTEILAPTGNWRLATGCCFPMLTDQAILRHIERQPHHSAGYKQLVREMGLRGEERRQLAERLKALVKSARLIETGRDRYTLAEHAAARQNLVAGRLTHASRRLRLRRS